MRQSIYQSMSLVTFVAAAGAAIVPAAHATPILDVFWVGVAGPGSAPYPPGALTDDPNLANMRTLDLMVYTSGDWNLAGMRATLPSGFTYYHHSLGGNTKPNPAFANLFPGLAYDTYVTAPGDTGMSGAPFISGGFPPGPISDFGGSSGVFSVSWNDTVVTPPGTYQIARLTFPNQVLAPFVEMSSFTGQLNPDVTTQIQGATHPSNNRWLTDADGSWHDAANWSQQQPPQGNQFVFLDVGGATVRTITHSQGSTPIHSVISEEHLVISGGTLTTFGGLNMSNGVTLDGGVLQSNVSGSPLTVGPAGGALRSFVTLHNGLVMSGGAPLIVETDASLRVHGDSTLSNGAVIQFVGNRSLGGTGTFFIPDLARMSVDPADVLTLTSQFQTSKTGPGVLRINGSFTQSTGSVIDMVQGSVINDYTGPSPFDAIRSNIISGYNNGSWNGTGINSSTAAGDDSFAVGYAEASALFTSFPATFEGEAIDDTTVLVRLTRAGDANLDGVVNLADFNRLAANFGRTNAVWSDGDFNYDGAVNLADFNKLAANFGLSATGRDAPTPEDWFNLAAAIPEPSVPGLLAVMAAPAVLHRRRRS